MTAQCARSVPAISKGPQERQEQDKAAGSLQITVSHEATERLMREEGWVAQWSGWAAWRSKGEGKTRPAQPAKPFLGNAWEQHVQRPWSWKKLGRSSEGRWVAVGKNQEQGKEASCCPEPCITLPPDNKSDVNEDP